eukprot:gene281-1617_t
MNLLVQYFSNPRYRLKIPKEKYYPAPGVDGALTTFDLIPPEQRVKTPDVQGIFMSTVYKSFLARRKMIKNNLQSEYTLSQIEKALKACELRKDARAQDLNLKQFANLVNHLHQYQSEDNEIEQRELDEQARLATESLARQSFLAMKMASCKSDLEYNCATASSKDEIVYGAARPGAKSQRCFNSEDKVSEAEVVEWATYMKAQGIKCVVGLLSSSELDTYAGSPPSAILESNGLQAVNIQVEEGDAEKWGKHGAKEGVQRSLRGSLRVVQNWVALRVAKRVAKSKAESGVKSGEKIVAKSGVKRVAKRVANSGAESGVKSCAKRVAKSGVKSGAESGVKRIAKRVAKSGAKRVAKSGVKSGAESGVKRIAKRVTKSGAKRVAEGVAKRVTKSGAESGVKSGAESVVRRGR